MYCFINIAILVVGLDSDKFQLVKVARWSVVPTVT